MELNSETIVRAWRDDGFRASLSDEQRAAIPPAPDNLDTLDDDALRGVAGGLTLPGVGGGLGDPLPAPISDPIGGPIAQPLSGGGAGLGRTVAG